MMLLRKRKGSSYLYIQYERIDYQLLMIFSRTHCMRESADAFPEFFTFYFLHGTPEKLHREDPERHKHVHDQDQQRYISRSIQKT